MRRPWGRIWLVSAVVTLSLFAGLELFWRSKGVPTSVQDTGTLWALEREMASEARPGDVALLGSSRSYLGLRKDILQEAWPGRNIYQLALNGGEPTSMLEDFAADPTFKGTILYEVHIASEAAKRSTAERTTEIYLKRRRELAVYDPFEARAKEWLQSKLVFLNERVSFKLVLRSLAGTRSLVPENALTSQQLPGRVYVTMGDTSLEGLAKKFERQAYEMPKRSEKGLQAQIERVHKATQAIRARGGEVLFFRINTSGGVREAERKRFPRAKVYDRMRARIGGTWIHFEDEPTLRDFTCLDGSHVMRESSVAFSKALAKRLEPLLR